MSPLILRTRLSWSESSAIMLDDADRPEFSSVYSGLDGFLGGVTDVHGTSALQSLLHDKDPTPRTLKPRPPQSLASNQENTSSRSKVRRRSEVDHCSRRPKLGRKAATAPPGTLKLFVRAPQPPRRAISARDIGADLAERNYFKRCFVSSRSHPAMSRLGSSVSRSAIKRRKSSGKATGRSEPRSMGALWRLLPQSTLQRYKMASDGFPGHNARSFSERARVKETLQTRKMGRLRTDLVVEFEGRELPDTPGSVVETPRELYRPSGHTTRLSPISQPRRLERRLALMPFRGTRAKPPSWTSKASMQSGINVAPKAHLMRSGQDVYLPGPIRLVIADSKRRMPECPIDTLEQLDDEEEVDIDLVNDSNVDIGQEQGEPEGQDAYVEEERLDMLVVDEMAEYFESFGLTEPAKEDELDKFWDAEAQPETEGEREQMVGPSLRTPDWKARIRLGLDEPSLSPVRGHVQVARQNGRRSRLLAAPSPNPHQRIRLRRLLSSATSML